VDLGALFRVGGSETGSRRPGQKCQLGCSKLAKTPSVGRQIFNQWTTREVHKWLLNQDSEPRGVSGAGVPCMCVVVAPCL